MSSNGFIVNLTHDIDFIRKTYQYITHDLRWFNLFNVRHAFRSEEPYWTFENMMKVEEKAGVRSTFFFLEESIPWNFFRINKWNLTFGKYKFSDPAVKKLIKTLKDHGWEVALHGSFNSYRNEELLKQEKLHLEDALGDKVYGVRQHFLNLDIPLTWKLQREAGFVYDSSLGRRHDIGFYQNHYVPLEHKKSGMLIIPITIMDTYIRSKVKGEPSKVWKLILEIIDEAEMNGAVLSILWHNNYFNENEYPGYGKLYNRIIWECKNRGAEFLTSLEIYKRFSSEILPETETYINQSF
jgi:peptidoglycan/xylan/chitin deacetylase (PgdA/CDA1 family)